MNYFSRFFRLARREGYIIAFRRVILKLRSLLRPIGKISSIKKKYYQPKKGQRELFVDVSEISAIDWGTGIQRVTRSIFRELYANPPAGYVVSPVYADENSYGYRRASISYDNDHLIIVKRPIGGGVPIAFGPNDIFLGLDWVPHVANFQVPYFKLMMQSRVKVYFLLHDLLPVTHSDFFPEGSKERHIGWLNAISLSDGVIAVSKSSLNEYRLWLSENNIQVKNNFLLEYSHNGADIHSQIKIKGHSSCNEYRQLTQNTSFLMVGTLEPRKGYTQVLDAFEQLWLDGIEVNLILVGKPGWKTEELVERLLHHPEFNKRLFWFDRVSDESLEKLYSLASCLIAASFSEGFGLPLIEAAQHKMPIIARDIPVFREVACEHAFYFEDNELTSAIQNWLDLYEHNQHPSSINMPWLTWQQSTQQLLQIILAKR